MQQNTRSSGSCSWLPLILLIILIIIFYKQLFIFGLRIYTAAVDSPESDRIIADYYRTEAVQNAINATTFYKKILSNIDTKIQSMEPVNKAKMHLAIGRIYECGRGTKVDFNAAKSHYQKAQELADQSPDKDAITSKAEEATKRVQDESKAGQPPVCNEVFEYDIFQKFFGPNSKFNFGNNANNAETGTSTTETGTAPETGTSTGTSGTDAASKTSTSGSSTGTATSGTGTGNSEKATQTGEAQTKH